MFQRGVRIVDAQPFEFYAMAFLQKTDQRVNDLPLPSLRILEIDPRLVTIGETLEGDDQRMNGHIAIHPPVLGQRNQRGRRRCAGNLLGSGLREDGQGGESKKREEAAQHGLRCSGSAVENINRRAIPSASQLGEGQQSAVGGNFVVAENVDGPLALLRGKSQVRAQSEDTAVIKPGRLNPFLAIATKVRAKVAVVGPHFHGDDVDRAADVERH